MANAQAGRNLDILELARLTVPIRINQGGHGSTDAKQGLTNLIVNANGVPFKGTDYSGTLKQDTLTANRTWTLPDATGTIALDTTGRVLQVVSASLATYKSCTTVMPFDDTIPQNDEGDEVLTCSITPKSSSSKLYVEVRSGPVQVGTATLAVGAIFRDTTADAVAGEWCTSVGRLDTTAIEDSLAATATTFKFRAGPNVTGEIYFNGNKTARFLGGVAAARMIITEIAA